MVIMIYIRKQAWLSGRRALYLPGTKVDIFFISSSKTRKKLLQLMKLGKKQYAKCPLGLMNLMLNERKKNAVCLVKPAFYPEKSTKLARQMTILFKK